MVDFLGSTYGSSLYTTILKFLNCGSGSFRGVYEFKLALRAIDTQWFGSHPVCVVD